FIYGVLGFKSIQSESYPSVNFAMATIDTHYEGASAKDIEIKITKPIEDEIKTVTGLKDVRTISKTGHSSIFVRADMNNVDVEEVMSDLQKAVDRVSDLPADLKEDPKFKEVNSEEFPAVELAITGDNTNRKLDLFAELLQEEFEDNKRVLSARLVGHQKRQFNIYLDSIKLQRNHIGVNEVISTLQARNISIPGGSLENEGSKKIIRIDAKFINVEDIENVVVRANLEGEAIYLKDIARVEDSSVDATTLARLNGKKSVLIIINKKGGADTLKLVEEVESVISFYRQKYAGEFEIDVYNNEGLKVKNRLDILSSNAFSGLFLVIFFLLIFLPWRTGVVASMSLPLCIMGTIGLMASNSLNLDAITILALVIALGMMVDNAVVISENFNRLKTDGLSPIDAAFQSVSKLWLPITATCFTTIAAFVPMLVTKGIMGEFIKYIPIIVCIALVISLVESFFLLPTRLILIEKWIPSRKKNVKDYTDTKPKKNDWFSGIINLFERMMTVAVRHRYITCFIISSMLIGSIVLMIFGNKFILFPAEETEIYLARIEAPTNYTIEKTDLFNQKLSRTLEKELKPYVRAVVSRAGISNMGPSDPKGGTGDNKGLIIIYVNDDTKYNIKDTEFIKLLNPLKPNSPVDVQFEAMVNGPPVGDPINATFRGNNVQRLDEFLDKVINELGKNEGITNLKLDDIQGPDEIFVELNYEKLSRLNLLVQPVASTIRSAMSGHVVGPTTLNNKNVDVRVRVDKAGRKSLGDLEGLNISDSRNNLIPLKDLAKIKSQNGSLEIKRFDFKRSKTLTGSVDGIKETSQSANAKLSEIFTKYRGEYPDISLVFGGEEESTKESMSSLGDALVLALIGIFGLLVFMFNSFLRPFLIMTTIPLGMIGFSIAFYLHQRPGSFMSMIGLIGLAGIIVNSGIILISFIDDMRKEGKLGLQEILVKSSGMRLRAVLVTSLTTISGLLPTAYGIGGSDALLVPMTMAMAWGLTSGTFLTLVWIPCAYAIQEDFLNLFSRNKTDA
ncbi:efflux RND transporter permease subunit, partial [Bacteriovoracaceae bacterium]|nr:efflux RND transporter permease subunit [Bacteriovoracaceae bacterium]